MFKCCGWSKKHLAGGGEPNSCHMGSNQRFLQPGLGLCGIQGELGQVMWLLTCPARSWQPVVQRLPEPSCFITHLDNLPFLNLLNPFWSPFIILGFTTSGGSEPWRLMMCSVEKKGLRSQCLPFIIVIIFFECCTWS